MKAFIGEPADERGNALACVSCSRRARYRVGDEPRCGVHLTDTLPDAQRQSLAASRRDRSKQEAAS